MPVTTVQKITNAESAALAKVLARAFEADPMAAYLFPNPARKVNDMQRMFELFLSHVYLPGRECYATRDLQGGALWLPPMAYPPSARQQMNLLPGLLRLFGLRRTPSVLRDINHMETMHPKNQPHWYLAFLGVEPSAQGRGLGSTLLQTVLYRCDAERMPAYLETSNERNLTLYQRHGFEVINECDIPKGPHFWGMWRPPATQRT